MKAVLAGILSLFCTVCWSQNNRTITYQHFYNIRQLGEKVSYSYSLFGALFIQGDTQTVYRFAMKENELKEPFDIADKDENYSYLRSIKTSKCYNIVNSKKEHLLLQITSDTAAWELLPDRDTILNIPCMAAVKDSIVAWYAPSLPLQAGPLNLAGLPGTILKIFHLKYNYMAEAKKIEDGIPPIKCSARMLVLTDTKYLQRKKDLHDSKNNKTFKWFWQDWDDGNLFIRRRWLR